MSKVHTVVLLATVLLVATIVAAERHYATTSPECYNVELGEWRQCVKQ